MYWYHQVACAGLGALRNIAANNAENRVTLGGHIGFVVGIVEEHRRNAEVS